jgi:ABC-type glycerol-3-phosphate transport system substrate-binding protein
MRISALSLAMLMLAACGQTGETSATTSQEDAMPSTETVSSDDMAAPASTDAAPKAEPAAAAEKQ